MTSVLLKIVGTHIQDAQEEEKVELVTEGKFHKKGKTLFLTYDESEISGLEGCETRLALEDGTVSMTRIGSSVGISTEMKFEKGKRFSSLYDTPYGPIQMEVLTNNLVTNVTPQGEGTIFIDYSVSMKGLSEGRSKLNIEVGRRQ